MPVKENPKELGDILFLYRDTHGLTISTIHQVVTQGMVYSRQYSSCY